MEVVRVSAVVVSQHRQGIEHHTMRGAGHDGRVLALEHIGNHVVRGDQEHIDVEVTHLVGKALGEGIDKSFGSAIHGEEGGRVVAGTRADVDDRTLLPVRPGEGRGKEKKEKEESVGLVRHKTHQATPVVINIRRYTPHLPCTFSR